MPTLPGLSLLLDDDNKVLRTEPTPKVEPRKSFEQWKQQNKAIFIDNAAMQQRKPDKKQVRFKTDNQSICNLNGKSSTQRIPSPVSPNLELSYNEGSHRENFHQNQQQKDYHQHFPNHNSNINGHYEGYENNILLSRNSCKAAIASSFANDNAYNAVTSQTTVDIPYFKRMVRSESMKENHVCRSNVPVNNEQRQCHGICCQQSCQTNQNNWESLNHQTCNHVMQLNGCVRERRVLQSHQQDVGHKTLNPFSTHVDQSLKEQLTDDTLVSIMEEQQQHILLQQSQILMQQKQNMMQQNQIFMLQHQVQQLLQRNGNNPTESPNKLRQATICEPTTPRTIPNALQNAIKKRNGSTDSAGAGNGVTTKSSIGVMTSFLENVNEGIPNGIQQFNERFTTKLANEKFIEKIGGLEEYSYKDSMLDKINDAIKNSSAMIDYRNNGTVTGCVSPNRQSDINIAAQA